MDGVLVSRICHTFGSRGSLLSSSRSRTPRSANRRSDHSTTSILWTMSCRCACRGGKCSSRRHRTGRVLASARDDTIAPLAVNRSGPSVIIAPHAALAVVASLPFAPEIVLPAIDYFVAELNLLDVNPCGFRATFNPTRAGKPGRTAGWVSLWPAIDRNGGPVLWDNPVKVLAWAGALTGIAS